MFGVVGDPLITKPHVSSPILRFFSLGVVPPVAASHEMHVVPRGKNETEARADKTADKNRPLIKRCAAGRLPQFSSDIFRVNCMAASGVVEVPISVSR